LKSRYTRVINGGSVKQQSQKYWMRFTDADGIKGTIPLFRHKSAAQQTVQGQGQKPAARGQTTKTRGPSVEDKGQVA